MGLPWRTAPGEVCSACSDAGWNFWSARLAAWSHIPASHCPTAPLLYFQSGLLAQHDSFFNSCSHTRIAIMSFGGQTPTIVVLREGRYPKLLLGPARHQYI
jgi:hypothetical protein